MLELCQNNFSGKGCFQRSVLVSKVLILERIVILTIGAHLEKRRFSLHETRKEFRLKKTKVDDILVQKSNHGIGV